MRGKSEVSIPSDSHCAQMRTRSQPRCVASIVAPDGTALPTPIAIGTGYNQEAQYLDSTTLPQTGTYVVIFEGNQWSDSNETVQIFNAPAVQGSVTPNGAPVTVTASVPGQLTYLSFTGQAGENLTYSFSNVSASGCFNVTILDPNLSPVSVYQTVCNYGTFSGYGAGITLALDGTYQILFDPAVHTGSISFTLSAPTPVTGSISIGGAPVTMSAAPGQPEELSFSGTQGQQVSLGISNVTYGEIWGSVANPDGSSADSFDQDYYSGSLSASYEGPLTLGSTGTYTIDLTAEPSAGTAQIALYDASPVNEGTLTVGGAAVAVSGNPGQPMLLTFAGTAGQTVLDFARSTFGFAFAQVLDPQNNSIATRYVFSNSPNNIVSNVSLQSDGTYTVELTGSPGGAAGQNVSVGILNSTLISAWICT